MTDDIDRLERAISTLRATIGALPTPEQCDRALSTAYQLRQEIGDSLGPIGEAECAAALRFAILGSRECVLTYVRHREAAQRAHDDAAAVAAIADRVSGYRDERARLESRLAEVEKRLAMLRTEAARGSHDETE